MKSLENEFSCHIKIYKQDINYDSFVADMIKAGNYDWVRDDVTKINFPSSEIGKKEIYFGLFHFRKEMLSTNIVVEMLMSGYRPATLKELLAFGKMNPAVQRRFSIIALGSTGKIDGDCFVPELFEDDGDRVLGLRYFDDGWVSCYRFLAVRK